MDKLPLIVAAIESVSAAIAPDVLTKKPNVADVEVFTGFDITAAERDEAWDVFTSGAESGAVVTNNYSSDISLFGVTIKRGQSAEVPDFNAEHSVMKCWIEQKVITVK